MSTNYFKIVEKLSTALIMSMMLLLLPLTADSVEIRTVMSALAAAKPAPVTPGPAYIVVTNTAPIPVVTSGTTPVEVTNTTPIPVSGTVTMAGKPFLTGWRTIPNTIEPCFRSTQNFDQGSVGILEYLHITINANPADDLIVTVYSDGWSGSPDVPISFFPTAVPSRPGTFVLDERVKIPVSKDVVISICRTNLSAPNPDDDMSLVGFVSGTMQ